MLYDKGQILEYLVSLWSAGVEEPVFKSAIADVVDWLEREMTSPDGYFYAAQDADSFATVNSAEPEECDFYVWDYQTVSEILTVEELTELQHQFTFTEKGNFEGKNVLQKRDYTELSPTLQTPLSKLFRIRYGQKSDAIRTFPPHVIIKKRKL